jgi:hypothetical protein
MQKLIHIPVKIEIKYINIYRGQSIYKIRNNPNKLIQESQHKKVSSMNITTMYI